MAKNYLTSDDKLDDLMITEDSYLNLNLKGEATVNITVMENCGLELVIMGKDYIKDMSIKVMDSAILNYYEMGLNGHGKTHVETYKDTKLNFISSIIAKQDLDVMIKVDHLDENSKAQITNHIVNTNASNINVRVDDWVARKALNTISDQDNKIIDLANGNNRIMPNVIVDTDEVEAEHSSYIGKFKEEELFYLSSRGISKEDAKQLLMVGFLINHMQLSNKDMSAFRLFIVENLVS